jgi:hypothetical protein
MERSSPSTAVGWRSDREGRFEHTAHAKGLYETRISGAREAQLKRHVQSQDEQHGHVTQRSL